MKLFRIAGAGCCLLGALICVPQPVVEAREPTKKAKKEPAKPAEPPKESGKTAESEKVASPAKVLAKVTAPVAHEPKAPALPAAMLPGMGGRSPFAVPPKYTSAVQSLAVRGIVRTDLYSGAIVQVADSDQPVVLRVGQRFKLDIDDQRYEFKVTQIKEKSVIFKGKDDKNYEVPVQ